MDLLGRYHSQKSAGQENPITYIPQREGDIGNGGFAVNLVVKLSGGRIQSMRSVNVILMGIALLFVVLAGWILFFPASPTATPGFKEETRTPGTF